MSDPSQDAQDAVTDAVVDTDAASDASAGKAGFFKRIMSQPNDSTQKTLLVALIMCLVCSLVVSAAAIILRPKQEANAALDRKRNIVEVAGLLGEDGDIEAAFKHVQVRMVDLDTGSFTDEFTAGQYDQYTAAKNPAQSITLDKAEDIAGIGRRARVAEVYFIGGSEDDFEKVVLPVHGLGLWSTLYGFVSLENDLKTIAGLKFYDHGETPGLGAEVDNTDWRAQWDGKLAFDDAGAVQIEVIKGVVDAGSASAVHQVDGLAGATLTSRGVTQLVRFWLDEKGFGKFLNKLNQGEV